MVDEATFKEIALSFPDTIEQLHFKKTSFKAKKKTFATYFIYDKRAYLKFSKIDQSAFCSFNKAIVYPVSNQWGMLGWTLFELNLIEKEMLYGTLETAYLEVTKKKTGILPLK